MNDTNTLTPTENHLLNLWRASMIHALAKYKGYPAVIHVGTVDSGTVEINAPAGEIWQKRIRVNIADLTDKQLESVS